MEKETKILKELIKEIISQFVSIYSRETFDLPHALSAAYLRYKADGTPLDTILPFVNHRRHDDKDFGIMQDTEEYGRLSKRYGKKFAVSWLEAIVGFDSNQESMRGRLSSKTIRELSSNYSESAVSGVLDALCNFQGAVTMSKICPIYLNKILLPSLQQAQDKAKERAKNVDNLLQSGLIPEKEKRFLTLLRRIEEAKSGKNSDETALEMDMASQLYFLEFLLSNKSQLILVTQSSNETFYSLKILLLQIAGFFRNQGRPTDIFRKALIGVVYTLLAQEQSQTKTMAKSLTSRIINEAYKKRIKSISPKTVDNTILHSRRLT